MSCEQHKVRKRPLTCEACAEELKEKEISTEKPREHIHIPFVLEDPILDITKEEVVTAIDPPIIAKARFDEKEYIQALVEKELKLAIAKIKGEINELKNIQWEHLHVSLSTFNLALLFALEKEGWKYCEMVRDGKRFGYIEDGEFVILQRIKNNNNVAKPDFAKRGVLKKYLEVIE